MGPDLEACGNEVTHLQKANVTLVTLNVLLAGDLWGAVGPAGRGGAGPTPTSFSLSLRRSQLRCGRGWWGPLTTSSSASQPCTHAGAEMAAAASDGPTGVSLLSD